VSLSPQQRTVRIGGASGFWGDSSVGAPQLVASGQIDYLVFDYLAELTMSILAAARQKNAGLGYATDFVTVAMRAVLKDVVQRGIRVVSNAGGVNPQACAAALQALANELGVNLKIAVVTGDDVMPVIPALREAKEPVRELQSGVLLPERVVTANAYLGALPVKAALDAEANVVITGRCVDSAVTLGVLMHEFGWSADDYDRLAAGSLAGHIIECGCQATGGLFTDWDSVSDWAHIGYPIVQCRFDGDFTVTKPVGTGGLVAPAVVAEQILYEIGDPSAYLLPDVTCDFTGVKLLAEGPDRVGVHGARGRAPTSTYKVCATYVEGFKLSAQLSIVGFDAVAKARRTGEAILERTSELLKARGLAPYTDTMIETLGAESCYGPHARAGGTREAVLRLTATHRDKAALELLARELAPAGTSWAPGTTGGGGRASASPSIRQYAFLLDKSRLQPQVRIDGRTVDVAVPAGTAQGAQGSARGASATPSDVAEPGTDALEVPLIRVAWGRSGDKGDISNIGIIARHPTLLPFLRGQLTPERVAQHLAHLVRGSVTRYEVPGIHAFNFVCEQALGGGGMKSLRNDALGKGMAQILLAMPVRIPVALLSLVRPINGPTQ
jgi:Acyclic terpene utilisation family protein AtuA